MEKLDVTKLNMDALATRVETLWEDTEGDHGQNVDRAINLAMTKLGNGFRELLTSNGYVSLGSVLNQLDDAKDDAETYANDAEDEDSMEYRESIVQDWDMKLNEVEDSHARLWYCGRNLLDASPVSCDDFTEMMHSYQYLLSH